MITLNRSSSRSDAQSLDRPHGRSDVIDSEPFFTTWEVYQKRIEGALTARLPDTNDDQGNLHRAMRYVCLGGGKRLRASLVYACAELAGAAPEQADAAACAIEMVHAYSLTHDDLPAMDDDDIRRGKPSCHVAFDQVTAILAGDALQSLAFEVLASDPSLQVTPETRTNMLAELAQAIGFAGMAGGQALDMAATAKTSTVDELRNIHLKKTGALIRTSARLGLLCSPSADDSMIKAIEGYANALGLSFQIVDDILDHTGDSEIMGKPGGSDDDNNKTTWVSVRGLDLARQDAEDLYLQALESLALFGDNRYFLQDLATFVIRRNH